MKKTTKLKTPKKGEALKNACQFQNELEFNTKNMAFDLKSWEESLGILGANIDKFNQVVQKTATMTSQELAKEFSETQSKLEKIKKEIEAKQKAFNKFQIDFEKKLVLPIDKGDFNGLSTEILAEIRENIQKTQAGIALNMQSFRDIIEKDLEYVRKLVLLEESITKICLPDEMEKTDKINDGLMKRLTALCEMTSAIQRAEDARPREDALSCDLNLAKSFSHLYAEHHKGEALLDRIQKNMRVSIPEPEEKVVQPSNNPPKVDASH